MAHALREIQPLRDQGEGFEETPITRQSFDLIVAGRSGASSVAIALEYPLHEGARTSLMIVAILCIVTVVASPLGIWILIRLLGAKVRISESGLVARGIFGTVSLAFGDVARLGVMEVPITARGLGGALVKRRVGGDKAINLIVKTWSGKTRRFVVSSYESHQDIVGEVMLRARKPCETIRVGLFGPKWPEDVAFS